MLRINIDTDTNMAELSVEGTPMRVMTEMTFVIRALYKQLRHSNEKSGELFKVALQAIIGDDESPAWKLDYGKASNITAIEFRFPHKGNE